ncbi:hypothetical protein FM076_11050 [Streptomyces albus subsp. chlorinus]|uniref:hypothetical protein n=1 Tax=Streptomyces albus TaxID=1888 RepID=UPI00156DC301|nr:hypothetical protein [Streptomyces albus]NSC21712.1 hypothetical protein [Streptomyces albus subsp. chlorinus]
MRNLVRNAATVVAAVGLAVSVAPAASAAAATPKGHHHAKPSQASQAINVYVGTGDAQFANEFGPGNLAANWIHHAKKIRLATQNEAIRTGHVKNIAKGKGASAPFEIEGSEQDQNEG